MDNARLITHKGLVELVQGEEITVNIEVASACLSCAGKAFCSMSEKQDKKIRVHAHNRMFSKGEEVLVKMHLSQGMRAVVWAYVIPLCILLIFLLTLFSFRVPEVWSGIISVVFIALYYFVLYLFRGKFNKKYVFEIEKI